MNEVLRFGHQLGWLVLVLVPLAGLLVYTFGALVLTVIGVKVPWFSEPDADGNRSLPRRDAAVILALTVVLFVWMSWASDYR